MNSRDAIDADKHPDLLNPEEPEVRSPWSSTARVDLFETPANPNFVPGSTVTLFGTEEPFAEGQAPAFDEARYRAEQEERWRSAYEAVKNWPPMTQAQNSTLLAALLDSVKANRQSKKLTRAEECLLILSDGRPHKTAEFQNPRTGSDGLRRLRELKAKGYRITRRKIEGSAQHTYQLEVTE